MLFARTLVAGVAAAALCACGRPPVEFGSTQALNGTTSVGAAPMFAVAANGDQAAAWISAPGGGADARLYVSVNGAPAIEIRDSLGPIEPHGEAPPKLVYQPDGSLAALYAVVRVVPGRRFPASALRFVRSADGGRSWSAPVTVTDDAEFGSHNFHALHAAIDGTIYASWLDGRDGKSAVYLTRSTDGGRTWAANQRVAGGESCPCCRTAIATAPGGVVYLGWREVAPGNVRDVVVARSTDGGRTFGVPSRVHADEWVFDGCPHAGPSMQTDSKGRLHVAWWTGKEGAAGAWYARSDDGVTFGPAIALGVAERSMPAHVQLAVAPGGRVVVAWDDGTARVPRVVVRVSNDGGESFGRAVPVSAKGDAGQFPVLAVHGDSLTVAWTDQSAAAHQREQHAMPDMRAPGATMPIRTVGDAVVLVRRGQVRG